MYKTLLFFVAGLFLLLNYGCKKPVQKAAEKLQSDEIAQVISWFPVSFALFSKVDVQYIAYYDTAHNMVVAKKNLEEEKWETKVLDSKIGWDSHNYLSLYVDSLNFIHLVGNMHSSPLVYFKSSKPEDIHSMKLVHKMIGTEEDVTTYPEFIESPQGEVIFHYRYGVSGNGYEVYNKLNVRNQKWQRLLDVPLTDGKGKMNAYMQGPNLGPDGFYHLIWVWRDTPDCSTNHTLSYARSKDLLNWESVRGESIDLPVTLDYKELYVDETPIKQGLINIGIKIGYGSDKKPVIGYHKYDDKGNTQLFVARYENETWVSKQVTNWDYRWDFKGYGTIENELLIDEIFPVNDRYQLIFGYHHIKYGDGQVLIDEETLSPISTRTYQPIYPEFIDSLESDFPEILVHKVMDAGKTADGYTYMLRWEALPPNRDNVREGDLPKPSMLRIIKYSTIN